MDTKSQLSEITVSVAGNSLLKKVVSLVNANQEIQTYWELTNVMAIDRLNMTDHGLEHFQLVATTSMRMLRLLTHQGIKPNLVTDFSLSHDQAEVVVFLAAVLHDVGMSIHRRGHEEFSLSIADRLLQSILDFLPDREKIILISEVLHAIISHRKDGQPLTIEAGVVRVADALDMSEGRTRLPYDQGKLDIHSVSALAVDEVIIKPGKKGKEPIRVEIVMNHTAGIFQVDELLKKKVTGSGIEHLLDIVVYIQKDNKRQLFKQFAKKVGVSSSR